MKTFKYGERPPYGLARLIGGGYLHNLIHLKLPFLIWHKCGYDFPADEMISGWWVFELSVRKFRGRIEIGWWWALVKRDAIDGRKAAG
jgi:hypothetical protein